MRNIILLAIVIIQLMSFLTNVKGAEAEVVIGKKVMLLVFNPIIESRDNKKLTEVFGWNNPAELTQAYINDVRDVSGEIVQYTIVERLEIDAFPLNIDGFQYTDETYLEAWATGQFYRSGQVDYRAILSTYGICEKLNQGQIDELWIFGAPHFGFFEAILAGHSAFFLYQMSPPLAGTNCHRLLPIMGFDYSGNAGNMLTSFGRRVQGTMTKVYGGWSQQGSTPWDKFTWIDQYHPGQAQCGNVDHPPNTTSDYFWSDRRYVLSAADDWYTYPNLPGNYRMINCSEWGGNSYGYGKWWLRHLPKSAGKTDGKWNNWWKYVVAYDNATSSVIIDEHGRTWVWNNAYNVYELFFPLGLYASIGPSQHNPGTVNDLDIIADSPFNVIMDYSVNATWAIPDAPPRDKIEYIRQYLDAIDEHGLKIIYSEKDFYPGLRYYPVNGIGPYAGEENLVRGITTEFKDHPALLAWYIVDELPLEYYNQIYRHREIIKEVDGQHPTWIVVMDKRVIPSYIRLSDCIGMDPYPIAYTGIRLAYDWSEYVSEQIKINKILTQFGLFNTNWIVPQAHDINCYYPNNPWHGFRAPTYQEMLNMGFQCLIGGAKGLIFYNFADFKRDSLGFEARWRDMKSVGEIIKSLIPPLLSIGENIHGVTLFNEAQVDNNIKYMTKKVGEELYLFTVNLYQYGSYDPEFKLPYKNALIEDIVTQREFKNTGDTLTENFEPIAVHVYKIKEIRTPEFPNGLSDIVVDEDCGLKFVYDLYTYVLDSDTPNDRLNFRIAQIENSEAGLLIKNGHELHINPGLNWNGNTLATIEVSDPEGNSSSAVVYIKVNPVNDPPEFEEIGNKIIDEGKTLSFQVKANDIDSVSLILTASNLPSGATFESAAGIETFTLTPAYTQAGSYNVSFGVSDGELSDSETITITVINVNRPPAAKVSATPLEGNVPLTVQFKGSDSSDPDGDKLTYFWKFGDVSSISGGGTSTQADPIYTYKAAGTYKANLKVTDPYGASSETSVNIVVRETNTPPKIVYLRNWWNIWIIWHGWDKEDRHKLNYSYRIDNGSWGHWYRMNWVYIPRLHLRPGLHTFYVKAIDSKGLESEIKSCWFYARQSQK